LIRSLSCRQPTKGYAPSKRDRLPDLYIIVILHHGLTRTQRAGAYLLTSDPATTARVAPLLQRARHGRAEHQRVEHNPSASGRDLFKTTPHRVESNCLPACLPPVLSSLLLHTSFTSSSAHDKCRTVEEAASHAARSNSSNQPRERPCRLHRARQQLPQDHRPRALVPEHPAQLLRAPRRGRPCGRRWPSTAPRPALFQCLRDAQLCLSSGVVELDVTDERVAAASASALPTPSLPTKV
jgi:hypothetical protein